jgi:hypothetical protein
LTLFTNLNVTMNNPNLGENPSWVPWWDYSAQDETALFSAPTPPDNEDDFYARGPAGDFTDIGPLSEPAQGENIHFEQATLGTAVTADLSHVVYETES